MVSIYDLVVGDVVPLKIGDQVERPLSMSLIFESCVYFQFLRIPYDFFARFPQMVSLSVATPFP
jgi:hypothetical protein